MTYGGRFIDFVMSDVVCNGDEYNLADCSFNHGDNVSCPTERRASVICEKVPVRLQRDPNKRGQNSGVVQIFVDGRWRKICSSTWDVNGAKVVCQQLGLAHRNVSTYKGNVSRYENHKDPWDKDYWEMIDDVHCTGNERHIGQCNFNYKNNDFSKYFWCFNEWQSEKAGTHWKRCNDGNVAGVICGLIRSKTTNFIKYFMYLIF
ncbi:unnamed protein product [Owenia fusiformis]|uniref:Uncharacterized protein n=1 Tax=Owenia fusiformis TaxID=6347 RepID=A0A8J1UQV0_OWEFU|nr:unnamed protein product [Owenia fusiformis]